jgi:hypothetical protein
VMPRSGSTLSPMWPDETDGMSGGFRTPSREERIGGRHG